MAFNFNGRIRSFRFAFEGLFFVVKTQYNAWIHLFFTLVIIGAGLFFDISKEDWSFVVFSFGMVWIAEILNTAFELLCDVTQPDFHPIVKKAKDVSAGAVLVAAITAVVTGILVFKPYIFS